MFRPTNLMLLLIASVAVCAWPAVGAADNAPGTPRVPSPPDGAVCIVAPVTLDWRDVPDARTYQVQIGTTCGVGGMVRVIESETDVSSLEPGTTYIWRVRTWFGYWGPWSDCWSFSTPSQIPPGIPAPTSPPDGTLDMPSEVSFEWECVPGAASYEVRLGPNCANGSLYSSTECGVTIPNLEPGTEFCWRVRAKDVCDLKGGWSECGCFKTAGSTTNSEGKWALHYAGQHSSKSDMYGLETVNCAGMVVDAPPGPGRYDVYVIAVDVDAVAGTRYGLACDGPILFYGWTNAGDLEIATDGWPGCTEGNAQVWSVEQPGPHVTIGILDVYVYSSSNSLSVTTDPRVDFAEWCDGTMPRPKCVKKSIPDVFGSVGFGAPGTNPCSITPVGLDGFAAQGAEQGILLEWTSAEGADFSRFFVHRSATAWNGDYQRLNNDPIEGAGPRGFRYSYTDTDVIPGTMYYYKLEGLEYGGESVFFGPYKALAAGVRPGYKLSQNVPNPFSRGGATEIHYSVAAPCVASIKILDAAGRLVRTITAAAGPGDNWVSWNGTDDNGRQVPSGVYFYEIQAGGFSAERKMMLVE